MQIANKALLLAWLFVTNVSFAQDSKKFDCLAGLCLGDQSPPVPKGPVTVSNDIWEREVIICSGRIVEVTIQKGWSQTNHVWNNLEKDATIFVGHKNATTHYESFMLAVIDKLVKLGWRSENDNKFQEIGGMFITPLVHKDVNGKRIVMVSFPPPEAISAFKGGWMFGIMSTHPDRATLCEKSDMSGL